MSMLTGVRAIMKDIVETLKAAKGSNFINLSAGNPVIIPEVEKLWRDYTQELLNSEKFGSVVCRYGASQGYEPLVEAIVNDFNKRYDLKLTDKNVLVTPGSQSLYFFAANVFGGYSDEGSLRQVVLPLCPDYTGYGGVSLSPEAVLSFRPELDIDESSHSFKYRPNFKELKIDQDTGCVIFSRPCNPTGNVLTEDEVLKISAMAERFSVPLFIDSAYAPPFPSLNFTEMKPVFGKNIIHCMSLSKAGLPGERIGIALGDANILEAMECFLSNAAIHSPRYGQAIVARAIESGALADVSVKVIRPFYRDKFALFEAALQEHMPKSLPWFLHRGEGSIFAWMWFRDLPISDSQLYVLLKSVGVIAVPGNAFFPGLNESWSHTTQCMRFSMTAPDTDLSEGARRIAKIISEVYKN